MNEWTYDGDIARGTTGRHAKLVQEWLCLHDMSVAIDSGFGPATEAGVRQFQQQCGLPVTGTVDQRTFSCLVAPMLNALKPVSSSDGSLGAAVVACARQHLAQSPREVGGQNRGPWVRLYMAGNEGDQWPWCAGFVSFVVRQAAESLGRAVPIATSFSCDLLAAGAQRQQFFLAGSGSQRPSNIAPGSIFLVRRIVGDWVHTGIVTLAESEFFHTIEGNTNDSGSREGFEVCARVRGYNEKDFITLGAPPTATAQA